MTPLIWFIVVNLLVLLIIALLVTRRAGFAVPWLGLAVVVIGTGLAFNSSAILFSNRGIGLGLNLGYLITSMYGFIGLCIVFASVQFRAVPFIPLGAIVAGIIHIASFYAFIPPFAFNPPGMLMLAAPGFLLIAYGAYLWYRHGLAESLQHWNLILRLRQALLIVVGLGILGFLQFERPGPHSFLARPPDFSRIAETTELVAEGLVTDKESFKFRAQNAGSTTRYTIYEMDVVRFWRGTGPKTIDFAVPNFSPVEMTVGQPYLIFSSGMINSEKISSHWSASDPTAVWTVSDGKFYPYPGLPREAPITRDFVVKLLESTAYAGN